MRLAIAIRLAILAILAVTVAAVAGPPPARAGDEPSVKQGFEEVGRAIEKDSKKGWDATKDATKEGWDATKKGTGTALEKTGEGLNKAGDAVTGAGSDVKDQAPAKEKEEESK